jgi:hypothetical protein
MSVFNDFSSVKDDTIFLNHYSVCLKKVDVSADSGQFEKVKMVVFPMLPTVSCPFLPEKSRAFVKIGAKL